MPDLSRLGWLKHGTEYHEALGGLGHRIQFQYHSNGALASCRVSYNGRMSGDGVTVAAEDWPAYARIWGLDPSEAIAGPPQGIGWVKMCDSEPDTDISQEPPPAPDSTPPTTPDPQPDAAARPARGKAKNNG